MAKLFDPPPHVMQPLVGRQSGREARRLVGALLATVDHADWHDDAVLVVSELVANAVEATGGCRVAAWYIAADHALRVEVSDVSPDLPVPQEPSSTRVGGHGLRIVEALSTRWGVEFEDGVKIVWFEIDG